MKIRLLITFLCIAFLPLAQADTKEKKKRVKKSNSPLAQIEDVAGLPRVLIIGDSISIGYTLDTRKALAGKANVHRPSVNCGPTLSGLAALDNWLATGGADKKWDVIHFNWGLHDLKYLGPNGENLQDPNDPKSHQQVPPEEYRKNLTELVERLQATGAKLIWRNTTPVPKGAKGRVVGDSAKYNAIAAEIMEARGIPTHDLYALVKNDLKPEHLRKADVHYTNLGSKVLADDVARVILEALNE
jgi:acyl-CoA thioesterase-1